LLTFDIPFIFYDGIVINRELANTDVDVTATLRRSRNTDVQIDVPIDDPAIS
jgi:hypothetical protein